MMYCFPKEEKLRLKRVILTLFRKGRRWRGKWIVGYYIPWDKAEGNLPQVLFSVPKARVKKAVDRNKVKRHLREAYRHHKHLLRCNADMPCLLIGCVYQGKELPPYKVLLEEMRSFVRFLTTRYSR